MRGKQPWYSPRLCMLTLSFREKGMCEWLIIIKGQKSLSSTTWTEWLFTLVFHRRHRVSLSVRAILGNLCSLHNAMSCVESVHHTHSNAISCLWLCSQYGLSHQLMGEQGSLWWEFDCGGLLYRMNLCFFTSYFFWHTHAPKVSILQLFSKMADMHLRWILNVCVWLSLSLAHSLSKPGLWIWLRQEIWECASKHCSNQITLNPAFTFSWSVIRFFSHWTHPFHKLSPQEVL